MFRMLVLEARASVLCAAVFIGLVSPGAAQADSACTIEVVAGQSIQAAIDGASPGATVCVGPGTYQENLLITKDGITLKGAGPGITILEPPAQPVPVCLVLFFPPADLETNGLNGVCVAKADEQGKILGVVSDVRVTGFTVQGFPGAGIVFAGTNRPRADHNLAVHNGYYGITAFDSTRGRFEDNTSYGSGDAGFYVGNSPKADFTVQNNTAIAALWGILVRDSATGRVTGNMLLDNCSGLVFLNTGTRAGVSNWRASHNVTAHNDNFCPGKVTGLPFNLTGLGVLIAGGDHIVLRDNTVPANQPSGAPAVIDGVALAGGIVVVSTANVSVFPGYYGSDASHNLILNNAALVNQPFDLAYDGLGVGDRFVFNRCGTSYPAGLCREREEPEAQPTR
jgi:parallel beta-helix repeat protein